VQASATPQIAIPAAPTGVVAAGGDTQATVTWNSVSQAASYNLYYSSTPGVTTANGTKITGVTSPKVITSLTDGTSYYFVVTAVNAGGESTASTQVTATPQIPPPSRRSPVCHHFLSMSLAVLPTEPLITSSQRRKVPRQNLPPPPRSL
jgi:hypothetical protein